MIRLTPLLLLPLFSLGTPVCFAEVLNAHVQLTGSIIDSACTIRVGNNNQTVAFRPLAMSGLLSGDSSSRQPLTIYISDCVASHKQNNTAPSQLFKLTFEGQPQGKYFGVQGKAKGIALQIKDGQGKSISPGMLLEYGTHASDGLLLNYSLTLVGSDHTLEAGDYHATIKLNIQHF